MSYRYRLGWKIWVPAVIGWLGVAALFTGLGVKNDDLRFFFIAAIFFCVSVLTGVSGYTSWVEICPKGIGGHWNNRKYFIPWRSIHAVWVDNENTSSTLLRLGTDLGTIILSLRGLPTQAILWNVRFRLPPNTQTPQAQQLYTARRKLSQRIDPQKLVLPLEIGHSRRLKILLWCSALFWAVLIYLNWVLDHNHLFAVAVCIFFFLLNLAGQFLLMERIILDSHGITSILPFRKQFVAWDEIVRVRMGSTGQTVIVESQGKRLLISGLRHWHGMQAGTARKFFLQQIEMRNITPELDRWVEFKIFTRNLSSRQA